MVLGQPYKALGMLLFTSFAFSLCFGFLDFRNLWFFCSFLNRFGETGQVGFKNKTATALAYLGYLSEVERSCLRLAAQKAERRDAAALAQALSCQHRFPSENGCSARLSKKN